MHIRPVEEADLDEVSSLIRELASYEQSLEQVRATVDQLRRALLGPHPQVFCELVEVDGTIAGFALWFLHFSTWTGEQGIHLEDLFIRPAFRNRGCATALLRHLAALCVDRGYPRFQWNVLDWNQSAIDFYETLGAEALSEWTTYRLSGTALSTLGTSPTLPDRSD